MKSLTPNETEALKKMECLYLLNGNNAVSQHEVAKLINEIWMLPLVENTLLGALKRMLNDSLKVARCRNEFFALVGYDLDMVVRHYQLMGVEG